MADGDCVSVCERVNAPCCFCSKKKQISKVTNIDSEAKRGLFFALLPSWHHNLFVLYSSKDRTFIFSTLQKKKKKSLQVKQAHPLVICRSYLKPGCLSGDNVCVKIGLFAVICGLSPPWFNEDNHLSNEAFMGYRTHLIDDQVWWETHTPSCVMLLSLALPPPTHTHLILYKHKSPRQL